MTDFLIYDVKVAVLIAVFYMFYRVLLAKETFHRVNRVVLLATAIASFVRPFCVITLHETVMRLLLLRHLGGRLYYPYSSLWEWQWYWGIPFCR